MAGASDKARWYLEKYVPELQEYERKEIFTHEEITAIARKRNDFEHTLNSPRPEPSDYAKYITYEINLDNLKKKRCKRKGVKTTAWSSGQRTVLFILDRATKKFPGDLALWTQYINFCRREKANKRLVKVFTNALRLKPRETGLWVLAAKHYMEEQGDMNTARSYLQRGLRFCKDERRLWLEYVRLEMVYLAKLAARRKILGLDEERTDAEAVESNLDSDVLALPDVTGEEWNVEATKGTEDMDAAALQRIASAPAFTGAIPVAIFDSAMKQFNDDPEVASEIFDVVLLFNDVPCANNILQHILDHLLRVAPTSVSTIICQARLSLRGVEAQSVEFPIVLGTVLSALSEGGKALAAKEQPKLADKALLLLQPYLESKDTLDEDVLRVLSATVNRYTRTASTAIK